LVRRLETNWATAGEIGQDGVTGEPAPDFIPSSLFGELLVPEVHVTVPAYRNGSDDRSDVLGLELALAELAPGNVTRRYAVADQSEAHWIPLPDPAPNGQISVNLSSVYDTVDDGSVLDCDGNQVHCLRPVAATLTQISPPVSLFDHSQLRWSSDFSETGAGTDLRMPRHSIWNKLLSDCKAYQHSTGSQLAVRRYAKTASLTQIRTGNRVSRRIDFVDAEDRIAALGFQLEVDGIRIAVSISDDQVRNMLSGPQVMREYRWAFVQELFENSADFPVETSVYERHWLRLACIATLCDAASSDDADLRAAMERLGPEDLLQAIRQTIEVMFPAFQSDPTDPASTVVAGRTLQTLRDLLADPSVLDVLLELLPPLWEPPGPEFIDWARRRLLATLGGVVIEATHVLAPDVGAKGLAVDVVQNQSGLAHVWITETEPGSTGAISRITQLWQGDSNRFLRVMDSVARPGDLAAADQQLQLILSENVHRQEVAQSFQRVRSAWDQGHTAVTEANHALRAVLDREGLRLQRLGFATLINRILSPGSSAQTDELFRNFVRLWNQTEDFAGIAIDSRVAAFVASNHDSIREMLRPDQTRAEKFGTLSTLLWPRGPELARAGLEIPNRFVATPIPDVYGLRQLLGDEGLVTVEVNSEGWRTTADNALVAIGSVVLRAPLAQQEALKVALLELSTKPTEIGFLQSYARIDGLWTSGDHVSVRLYVEEMT